ncbi:MAG: O-antigen translocase [Methylobacterium mesophilicum]|nr:O-antigen translocase [Methylobacterium mesophilicum]
MSVSAETLEAPSRRSRSHLDILRSTAIIGSSSLVNILLAVVRAKAMAILLGPSGVGLMGLYNSVLDLAQSLAGLGVQASGVRQIAEAAGTGEAERLARTATVLRRLSVGLGVIGALLLVALSVPVARLTFGDESHAAGIALLSLALFCRIVAAGQAALLQGLRRIGDLARISVLGGLASTLVGLPLIYLFGADGVVLSILAITLASLATSWWFARKVSVEAPRLSASAFRAESRDLFKLGFAFLTSGLLMTGAAYLVRLIVLHNSGLAAAGFYQSAWTLGGLYAGFILQAMGTDFYPRLTGVAADHDECNRMVNEQAQISMLLAGPGLMGTLTAAPLVMTLFYSPEFMAAVEVLRWICLGMMLRVVVWPMGFIVLAKNTQRIFVWTELAAVAVQVLLAFLLVPRFGPAGAGMAFCGLYLWHGLVIFLVTRRLTGFRPSAENLRLGLVFLPSAIFLMLAFQSLGLVFATLVGGTVTFATGLYALHGLAHLVPPEALPRILRPLVARLTRS